MKNTIYHEQNRTKDRERLRGRGNREIPPPPRQFENLYTQEENPVGICEDIKNEVFDLLHQKQTDLFTNSLKGFYYICGINFQRNRRYVKYAINNPSNITLYAKTEPSFEAGKTALSIVQKVILDAKINKFVDRE